MEIGQTSTDSFVDVCALYFDPCRGNQTKELELIATRDFRDDGDRIMDLKIILPINVNLVDWKNHKNISNIKVSKNFR